MHLIKLIVFMFLSLSFLALQSQDKNRDALICYGDFYPKKVKGYTYVIIEPSLFSKMDIDILKAQNTFVLAYISLGEVNETASHFDNIKEETLGKNEIWNSYIIDISTDVTKETLSALIDKHLNEKGFDGLFLDNIDNYTKFGPTPEKKEDLIIFLESIKTKYADKILMQNAGLLIVDETKPFIDIIAIESIVTDYSFEKKEYQLRDKKDFEERLGELEKITDEYKIPILLVEYADTKELSKEIMKRLKKNKMSLFIGEIDLQKLPKTN